MKAPATVGRFGLHFGALAPSIFDQLKEQGVTVTSADVERIQGDVDAVVRLYLRGRITDTMRRHAFRRVMHDVEKLTGSKP
jgi:hypothetical protein